MGNSKHTAEPWKTGTSTAGKSVIFLAGDEPANTLGHEENWIDCNTEANARRIVACVNACDGISTEYLETTGLPEFAGKTLCTDMVQAELDAMTKQRDGFATKVADTELALFAENQKRADVERERDQLLGASQSLVDALEKLARLGAGDHYGNSDGNVIAQQALAEYRAIAAANLGDRVQVPAALVEGGA